MTGILFVSFLIAFIALESALLRFVMKSYLELRDYISRDDFD
jgi:hypothetical protein